MSTLAEELRKRDRVIVGRLSAQERVALAFKLGEADLETYRMTHGLTREEALTRLRRQRQQGRRPCRCLSERAP